MWLSFIHSGETIDENELTPKDEKKRLPIMNRRKHEQSRYLFTEGLFQLSLAKVSPTSIAPPSSQVPVLEAFSSSLQSADPLIPLLEIVEGILEAIILHLLDSIGGGRAWIYLRASEQHPAALSLSCVPAENAVSDQFLTFAKKIYAKQFRSLKS